MKTQEQIINEDKEAYESHFEDGKEVTDEAFRGHDVVLDKEELEKEIETKKVEEEKKHESLEVLREKLVVEAEDSLKQTFGEEKVAEPHKKLNTEEMYEELNKEKEHLSEMTNALKEQQLSKKKH